MRVLHTADWHLGQRFFERDRFEEHGLFLDFLLETIKIEKIDLLLVAGDVFDTANPPREAESLYFDFLRRLVDLKFCRAVIVGGNHDSAPHLDASSRLLDINGIQVVGAFPDDLEDAFFEFDECCVAAVPYLRDRDVRRAVAGESIDDLEARTKAGILECYSGMATVSEKIGNGRVVIATGHLTAVGGSLSDSERSVHIGNLGSISAKQFPRVFDYVALGHLHVPQAVGGNESIRYSGSPIPLSFGEANTQKEVRVLDVEDGEVNHRRVEVPVFRRLIRLKGSYDELARAIEDLSVVDSELTPWLELSVLGGERLGFANVELRDIAAEKGGRVLKVLVQHERVSTGDLFDAKSQVGIDELEPEEVFSKRLELESGELDREGVIGCFQTLLRQVQEGESR